MLLGYTSRDYLKSIEQLLRAYSYNIDYRITNTDVDHLTLSAGFIDQIAGWENGVDSSDFVDVSETLGVDQKTDGIYYAAATYEGIKDLSLSLWYYNYHDIAHVLSQNLYALLFQFLHNQFLECRFVRLLFYEIVFICSKSRNSNLPV